MSIFREIPPTAGFPLYLKDFLSIFSIQSRTNFLEEDFKKYLGTPYAKITYSGTSAFYFILESLKELSPKKTVIIPAFICPLVPLAIHRAGLRVAVCDINKDNFNFDLDKLKEVCAANNDILAILSVHLGGIPADLDEVCQIAQGHKIFVIEDCAQSLGSEYKGKKTGTLGDFAFFSLCRGKGLTIYEGGLAMTKNSSYSQIIDKTIKRLANNAFFSESLKIFELFGYWVFYRPQLFWWVYRMPQAFWDWRGKHLKAMTEYFTIDFPLHNVSKIRESIGRSVFRRLDDEINKQRMRAFDYIGNLNSIPGIKLITESPGSKASYPYLTLAFSEAEKCRRLKEEFRRTGLGVFQIYALAITDYDYLKEIVANTACPNAGFLAQNHITLTTSSFLTKKDFDRVVKIIKGA